MSKLIPLFFLIFILIVTAAIAQNGETKIIKFPQKELNDITNHQLQNINNPPTPFPTSNSELRTLNSEFHTGIYQAIGQHNKLKTIVAHSPDFKLKKVNKSNSDTLFIVKDSTISGTWTHTGPIVITSNSTLFFNKVNATILGDIILWGDSAKLLVDSSYIYSPQQYFYQRSLIAVMKCHVIIKNSTLDYSNLSHNLLSVSDGKIEMFNVTNIGFTTNSVMGNSIININGTNQAGEYVTTDRVRLKFQNATTVLLWHQFPDTAVINFSFPDGDTLASYKFNNTIPGVKGIAYQISVTNCKEVMWGMMPTNGSNITISNSKIRAIGLWFLGKDSITVSGLVDNSTYSDFKAPVSDRNLHLINSSVLTWSLYTMEKSNLFISGCILGEVGSEGTSHITGLNFTVDGSGGYFWSDDTSFIVVQDANASTYVRSQRNSMLLYAYSAITNGIVSAIGNSILFVVQSSLPEDPTALEGSEVWFAMINQPSQGYAGSVIPVTGSAWIDKGPSSLLMNFNYYKLFYQKQGDTAWTQIGSEHTTEVRNDTLGQWDTKALTAGQYNIKLSVTDDTPQKNTMGAIKSINLLPSILSINEQQSINNEELLTIHPNPVNQSAIISFQLSIKEHVEIIIFDITGREITTLLNDEKDKGEYNVSFDASSIGAGIYFVRFISDNYTISKKITLK